VLKIQKFCIKNIRSY